MDKEMIDRVEADPNYIALRRRRNTLGIALTIIIMVVYYGWVALIAFNKEFLAQRIGDGVTTIAIPIGLGVLFVSVLLTIIYVICANKTYDSLICKIMTEVQK